jgi:glucose-1-phosphate adenylyltransferase
MGNYIFSRDVLIESLVRAQRNKQHDFGSHVIPDLVGSGQVFAYDFATNVIPGTLQSEENGYWRDVGTISAYFEAHMDMLGKSPKFEIDNRLWPIHPSSFEGPATKILHGDIRNSIIAEGTFIHKAKIRNSVIRSGVVIEDGVSVDECIIMENVVLRKGCRLRRAIVDKPNIIGEGETFGFDPHTDRFRCHIDVSGISIIPKGGRRMKKTRE